MKRKVSEVNLKLTCLVCIKCNCCAAVSCHQSHISRNKEDENKINTLVEYQKLSKYRQTILLLLFYCVMFVSIFLNESKQKIVAYTISWGDFASRKYDMRKMLPNQHENGSPSSNGYILVSTLMLIT
jgi:hypothetical protein